MSAKAVSQRESSAINLLYVPENFRNITPIMTTGTNKMIRINVIIPPPTRP